MRILVIEDDPRIAVSISDSLQDLGHRTVEADTVADALDVIRGGAVDLVISDLGLADDVRAETFLEAIRTLHPTLPIIVATGLEPSQDLVMDDRMVLLMKPYGMADLEEAIARLTGAGAP
ncbi:response regulator [Alsobacter sp. SYSU BS001988]|jgi:CheY-like chemotaxis protein